jgi:hypothetical protein
MQPAVLPAFVDASMIAKRAGSPIARACFG